MVFISYAFLLVFVISKHFCWGLTEIEKIRCPKDKYGNEECLCPEDPITARYPDVSDSTCDFYYLCHLGRAFKRKCDPHNAFHPKLRECIPRRRIPLQYCKPLVNCPLRPNRYVEDKNDCTKYFLCYFGTHSHYSCPEDHYFEPNQERCIPDKMQADACLLLAKRNFYKTIGYQKSPPKTSISLDKAKAYMKQKNKTRAG